MALAAGIAACSEPNPAAGVLPYGQDLSRPGSLRIEPLSGAPWRPAEQLGTLLTDAAQARLLPVARDPRALSTYTVKGAATAGAGPGGTLVVVVLDVLGPGGTRVHRIVKETSLDTPPTSISRQTLERIAAETANDLDAWYRTAEAPRENADLKTGSTDRTAAQTPVYLVAVGKTPSDGGQALAAALRAALERKSTGAHLTHAYVVRGSVTTADAREGYTSVRIDWTVKTLDGAPLGLVSQQSDLPHGAIETGWDAIAQTTADAAADGVLELVAPPKTRSS